MPRGPQSIGLILAELMARNGFTRVQSAEAIERVWCEAAGELFGPYTRVGRLRRGKLQITVANSTLIQELTFRKPALLAALVRGLPDEKIHDLRFVVGPVS